MKMMSFENLYLKSVEIEKKLQERKIIPSTIDGRFKKYQLETKANE